MVAQSEANRMREESFGNVDELECLEREIMFWLEAVAALDLRQNEVASVQKRGHVLDFGGSVQRGKLRVVVENVESADETADTKALQKRIVDSRGRFHPIGDCDCLQLGFLPLSRIVGMRCDRPHDSFCIFHGGGNLVQWQFAVDISKQSPEQQGVATNSLHG